MPCESTIGKQGDKSVIGGGVATQNAGVCGHYRTDAVGWDFYERVCRKVGFPERISPELIGHFAGETATGWEVVDLWTSARAMETLFTKVMVDAISETIGETGVRSDIEPETREISRLVVGPAAADYFAPLSDTSETALANGKNRPVAMMIDGLAGGEADYQRVCDLLDFPGLIPQGLIVHVAGPAEHGWRTFDSWTSASDRDRWYSQVAQAVAAPGDDDRRAGEMTIRGIELKRILLNPELIAQAAVRRSRSSSRVSRGRGA